MERLTLSTLNYYNENFQDIIAIIYENDIVLLKENVKLFKDKIIAKHLFNLISLILWIVATCTRTIDSTCFCRHFVRDFLVI